MRVECLYSLLGGRLAQLVRSTRTALELRTSSLERQIGVLINQVLLIVSVQLAGRKRHARFEY